MSAQIPEFESTTKARFWFGEASFWLRCHISGQTFTRSGTATAAVLERRPHPVHPRLDGGPGENPLHPDVIAEAWLRRRPVNAAEDIHGQIKAMLARSQKYQKEAEEEKDFREGEIHARVSSVLGELDRLATEFRKREA